MRLGARIAVVLLASASPAWPQAPAGPELAAAGTPDGAKTVADGLAPYLGRGVFAEGIVKINPDPAGYRMTVDPQPLLDKLKTGDEEFRLSPYSVVISRRDDGNWNYFTDGKIAFSMRTTVTGQPQDFAYDIGPQRFKGVFAPSIASFLSGTGSVDGLTMRARQADSDIDASFKRLDLDMTGKPVADGAADFSVRQKVAGFTENVAVTKGSDVPPGGVRFAITAGNFDATTRLEAMRSRPIADLYSFFVLHPEYFAAASATDRALLAGSQDELKSRIRAAMPLWNRIDSGYAMSDLVIGSQFGSAKLARFTSALASSGISRSGSLTYAFGFSGLDLSFPAVPAWAATLMPKTMDLNLRVDNLDLQTPADIALADLDVARAEPVSEDARARIAEAFARNPPRFVLEPSRVASDDLQLAMSGSFAVGDGKPAATVDVTATGLDKAIATLQAAAQTQPEINQVVGGLSMAKGFGKPLPDGSVQWVVDASSDGSVKVNGFQIKGPDPAIDPEQGDDGDGSGDDDAAPPTEQAPTDDNAVPDVPPQP